MMTNETKTAEKIAAEQKDFNEFESRSEWLPALAENNYATKVASPAGAAKDGYYGLPMLKRPLWKWEIALYFFFEGISSGSFILGTLAEFFAPDESENLIRNSRYIALAALLPCPPLLIADLGKPQKFHHMLRVWKPKSPMNLGAWALTAYSLPVGLLALKQLAGDVQKTDKSAANSNTNLPSKILGISGMPFAITMLSYPGVLLSTTSTPVWSRTRMLGALFAVSSIKNAVAALSLANSLTAGENENTANKLEKIENLATIAAAAALTAYIATSKDAAEPLTKGRYAKLFWLGAVGIGLIAPTVIRIVSKKKSGKKKSILSSALSLAGGLALKWAVTHAGRASAENPEAAREATRPSDENPGWENQNSLNSPD